MNPKPATPLIPFERIERLIQLEPALVILGFAVVTWLLYKVLLKDISFERHRNLQGQFQNLAYNTISGIAFYSLYWTLTHFFELNPYWVRIASYVGLCALVQGAIIFVKTSRIFVFEYLFLSHMRVAVPLLLVNLSTLMLTVILSAWIISEIFDVKLAPLVATSAVFSLILGLALQDTLGNLFAGVALQFDKPYEIGDWIEIQNGGQKWVGQVAEISWRATVLIGFGDESITVPNRVVVQSEISNYATRTKPILRNLIFRIPYGVSLDDARGALARSVRGIHGVQVDFPAVVLVGEAGESWITLKLVYAISDFGSQHQVADRILTAALSELEKARIPIASPRLRVFKENEV